MKKYEKYYIGVDVGGGSIKYGVFGKSGKGHKTLITKFSIKTEVRKKAAEKMLTKDMLDAIESFCNDNKVGLTTKNLKGVAFAIPGPVVDNKILRAVNINWNKKYDLVGETKKRLGKHINVKVLNDANAAALGEYQYDLKRKYKSICLFTLGTAVGVGIIIDGKLIEGKSGVAGELSHLKVDFSNDAIKCNCGNVGCLETVASGRGIANTYNRMYHTDVMKGAKEVVTLARKGDKKAILALETSLDYLSMMIAIVIHVYEPEVILIGGGVSYEGSIITDILKKSIKDKVFITKKLPKILIAKLKNEAGIYGAVAEL